MLSRNWDFNVYSSKMFLHLIKGTSEIEKKFELFISATAVTDDSGDDNGDDDGDN